MGDKLDILRNLFVYKGSKLYVYVYREAMKIITVEHIRRVVLHVRGLRRRVSCLLVAQRV